MIPIILPLMVRGSSYTDPRPHCKCCGQVLPKSSGLWKWLFNSYGGIWLTAGGGTLLFFYAMFTVIGWLVWNDSALAFKKAVQKDIKAERLEGVLGSFDWLIACRKALGLPANFSTKLFNGGGGWPRPYDDLWTNATTPQERAAIGALVIEHFIATDAGF